MIIRSLFLNVNWEWIILLLVSLIVHFSSIGITPALDRDESRYAQASRQMIETGNFISIKFQDESRNKKPVGIYWLQALSVKLLSSEKFDIKKNKNVIINDSIWKYRLPSALGALLTVLSLYFIGKKVYGRREAFYASLSLSVSFILLVESHIAKTDALLLAITTSILLILSGYHSRKISLNSYRWFFLLWFLVGFSVLIKGPISLIIIFMTLFFLVLYERDWKWLIQTRPFYGVLFSFIIASPWFFAIISIEGLNFFSESIGNDLFGKIKEGKEGHGAIFGTHSALVWILLWPFSLFILPSLVMSWKRRKQRKISFLIAWLVPSWILFEMLPTKLPHYTLLMYPAVTLMIGNMLNSKNLEELLNSKLYLISFFLFLLGGFVIVTVLFYGLFYFNNSLSISEVIISLFFLLILVFTIFIKKYFKPLYLISYIVTLGCVLGSLIFFFYLPRMEQVWVSSSIARELKLNNISGKGAILGYHEPSIVFELGTDLELSSIDSISNLVKRKEIKYVIVEEEYDIKLTENITNDINKLILIAEIKGFNLAKGKKVFLKIYDITY